MRAMLFIVTLAFAARAHDSPEHKVQELSFEIARSGKTPALLMERAIEHRALGELTHAAADFEAAFSLDPKLISALNELSLVQLAQGKPELALETITHAVAHESCAEFLMTRAEIHAARKDFGAALRDCEAAFRKTDGSLESYLLRAQLQRRLGLFQECLAGLREGFSKTGSAVLQEESIDAMIDAGQHAAALNHINRELADSRWRSSWLIRRARVRIAAGETKSARRDLEAALVELNQRITTAAPDVTLVIDRGIARALLGQRSLAQEDLRLARSLSSDPWMLWRLETICAAPGPVHSARAENRAAVAALR